MGRGQGGAQTIGVVGARGAAERYCAGQQVIVDDGDGRELAGTVLYDDGGDYVPVVLDEGQIAVNEEWEDNPEYEVQRSRLRTT